jgi:hypothetical protein
MYLNENKSYLQLKQRGSLGYVTEGRIFVRKNATENETRPQRQCVV